VKADETMVPIRQDLEAGPRCRIRGGLERCGIVMDKITNSPEILDSDDVAKLSYTVRVTAPLPFLDEDGREE
jgi:hypothetical protein